MASVRGDSSDFHPVHSYRDNASRQHPGRYDFTSTRGPTDNGAGASHDRDVGFRATGARWRVEAKAETVGVSHRLSGVQSCLDSAIGNEPHQRDNYIEGIGYPRANKGERDRRRIEQHRSDTLSIAADCNREPRVLAFFLDYRGL